MNRRLASFPLAITPARYTPDERGGHRRLVVGRNAGHGIDRHAEPAEQGGVGMVPGHREDGVGG